MNTKEEVEESPVDYKRLVDKSNDIIVVLDSKFRIKYSNNRFNQVFNLSKAEGRIFANRIPPDDLHRLARHLKSNNPDPITYSVFMDDGKEYILETTLTKIQEEDEIKEIQCISRDVTGKVEIEQRLKESEEKYRSITENAPLGIGIITFSGKFDYFNENIRDITGYSSQELREWNILDLFKLIKPDYLEEIKEKYKLILKEDVKYENYVIKIINKKDEEKSLLTDSSVIPYKGDSAILFTAMDITERENLKELYYEAFNNQWDGLMVLDSEGKIVMTNPAQFRISGIETDDYSIWNGLELQKFKGVKESGLDKLINTVLKTRQPLKASNFDFTNEKGKKSTVDVYFGPVSNGNTIICVHDVTEQKKAQLYLEEKISELKSLKKELEKRDWLQKNIIRKTSHHLRNHGQTLKYAKYLIESVKESDSEVNLEKISKSIDNLSFRMTKDAEIYENLLYSENLENYNFEPHDIQGMIYGVMDKYKNRFKDIRLGINYRLDKDEIVCDSSLEYVFKHLVGNAIHAVSKSREKSINIEVYPNGKDYVFSVRDSGKGIDEDKMKKVFELPKDIKGVDIRLGLYICNMIVENHHGSMRVESEPEEFSEFYFSIPKNLGDVKNG